MRRTAFHLLRNAETGRYFSFRAKDGSPLFADSAAGALFVFRDRAVDLVEEFARLGCIVTIVPPLPGKSTRPLSDPPRWWERGKEAA